MSDRFVVESDRQVVGVAVRVPGGFRFFASDSNFSSLEAKTFKRVRGMFARIAQIARGRARPRGDGQPGSLQ